jgi:hypothetical protein
MEFLGDMGHVEAHFSPFIDSANLDARKLFRTKPIELVGDVTCVESHFGLFRDGVSVKAR